MITTSAPIQLSRPDAGTVGHKTSVTVNTSGGQCDGSRMSPAPIGAMCGQLRVIKPCDMAMWAPDRDASGLGWLADVCIGLRVVLEEAMEVPSAHRCRLAAGPAHLLDGVPSG